VGYAAAFRDPPLFTNFGYAALGLPRTPDIPGNSNPDYFDMGVCGPERSDLPDPRYCGLFRVPGLRNVARRPVFFHNGVFKNLEQAVRFYATRDSNPQDWYPRSTGHIDVFNDLPNHLRGNVTNEAPFGTSTPRMNAQDQADLVCFLETLTDGFELGDISRAACR
jgi:cytochrome c peroxidase